MRAAPAFQVTLRSFGLWRSGTAALAGMACAALLAWIASRAEVPGALAVLAAATAAAAIGGLGLSLWRCGAWVLRWDGACWWLAPASPADAAALPGRLSVALDLGGWMLLRFAPWPPVAGRRWPGPGIRWLPAERRGLAAEWHGLRCTVHGPMPRTPGTTPDGARRGRAG